jgi:hypothetical protein
MTPDFEALERSILQCVVDKRWADLADLLHDDFVITTAGWLSEPASKQAWIAEVAESHVLHGFDIHLCRRPGHGRLSPLCWSCRRSAQRGGTLRSRARSATPTCGVADDGDRWRLAVRHASLLPKP